MTRLVAFLTAARRSHAERDDRPDGIAPAPPVWHHVSSHLTTVNR